MKPALTSTLAAALLLGALASAGPAQIERNRVKAHLRCLDVDILVEKTLDVATGAETFIATDLAGHPVDYAALLREERTLAARPERKIDPILRAELDAAGGPVVLGLWLRFDGAALDALRAGMHALVDGGMSIDDARAHLRAKVEEQNRLVTRQAVDALHSLGLPVGYVSPLAPIVFTMADRDDAAVLATLPFVDGLYADIVFQDHTDDAINTHRWDRIHDFGIRGDGVKVAVLEDNGIDDAACVSGILNVIGWNNANHNIQDHPTASASVIGSMDGTHPGHARGVQILSANGTSAAGNPSYATADIIAASDWAIGQGADIVNCSFGFNDTPQTLQMIDRYVDYKTRFNTTTFVVSAGNNGGASNNVSSPAVAWNCIAVGAINDQNTRSWNDDIMANYSSWQDPTSAHNDREKPEVSAEGTNITMLDLGCAWTYIQSGTSFAAPGISGICAALMQVNSNLKSWPELTKAVIMAAAAHNIEGASRLSEVDGAGGINGLQAYRLVSAAQHTYGTYAAGSFSNNGYWTYDVWLQGGDKTRIALVWDSMASGPAAYATDVLDADLDLAIFAGQGTTVGVALATSGSWDNSYEIVEFCPPSTGWYTIRVNDFRFDGTSEYYAIAWTQDVDGRYPRVRQWLTESTTETSSGPTRGNSFFYLDPVDYQNPNQPYVLAASVLTSTGFNLPAACRHVYGDFDLLTLISLDPAYPYFVNFTGTWSGSGTNASARIAIPDLAGLEGLSIYVTPYTLDAGSPDGVEEVGTVEKITFWNHATDIVACDDCATQVNLPFNFPFYAGSYNTCWISSNGLVSFTAADTDYSESVADLLAGVPKICALWDDLDMTLNASCRLRYRVSSTQLVVEWLNVPQYGTSSSDNNTVTLILNSDGNIELQYRDCDLLDCIVGVSPGGGATGTEVDLSHGWKTVGGSDAAYEIFTGAGGTENFDLGISSSYRHKVFFDRMSATSWRVRVDGANF